MVANIATDIPAPPEPRYRHIPGGVVRTRQGREFREFNNPDVTAPAPEAENEPEPQAGPAMFFDTPESAAETEDEPAGRGYIQGRALNPPERRRNPWINVILTGVTLVVIGGTAWIVTHARMPETTVTSNPAGRPTVVVVQGKAAPPVQQAAGPVLVDGGRNITIPVATPVNVTLVVQAAAPAVKQAAPLPPAQPTAAPAPVQQAEAPPVQQAPPVPHKAPAVVQAGKPAPAIQAQPAIVESAPGDLAHPDGPDFGPGTPHNGGIIDSGPVPTANPRPVPPTAGIIDSQPGNRSDPNGPDF